MHNKLLIIALTTMMTATVNAETTPTGADPSLRLVKSDGGIVAGLDRVVTYSLIYHNDGIGQATGVTLSETVPDYTTFYPPGSSPGWQCVPNNQAGSQCTLDLGILNGQDKGSAFFAVQTDASITDPITELSNTATLSASNAPSPASDTVVTPLDRFRPYLSDLRDTSNNHYINACQQHDQSIDQLLLEISDDQNNIEGLNDPDNYLLINMNSEQELYFVSCADPFFFHTVIDIAQVSVSDNSTQPQITLGFNEPLPKGFYALAMCEGITDAAGNALHPGVENHQGRDGVIRLFRIEPNNLFHNAYVDWCFPGNFDPPPWWQKEGTGRVSREYQDYNSSILSQSFGAVSYDGSAIGVSQCREINSDWPYRIGAQVRGDFPQTEDGTLTIKCDYSSHQYCDDVISSHSAEMTQSTYGGWKRYESILRSDPAAVAARCGITVSNASEPVRVYMDEFYWQDADLIFDGGFENSD